MTNINYQLSKELGDELKRIGATISTVSFSIFAFKGLIQVLKSSCESVFSRLLEHLFQSSNYYLQLGY